MSIGIAGLAQITPAHAAPVQIDSEIVEFLNSPANLSAEDWSDVAKRAQSAGDLESFNAAVHMKQSALNPTLRQSRSTTGTQATASLPLALIKAGLKALLRHGGPTLGKAVSPLNKSAGQWIIKNSNKLADLVDRIDEWKEAPVYAGLLSIGCDPANARAISQWVVTFT